MSLTHPTKGSPPTLYTGLGNLGHLRRRLVVVLLFFTAIGLAPHATSAQFIRGAFWRGIYPYGIGAWGGGIYPYYGYGSRSRRYGYGMTGTALSSNEFGMASLIASSGYSRLQNSQATTATLQARSTDFNNRVDWTGNYYQMRQSHRSQDAERVQRSMDDAARIAHNAAPRTLDAAQLDAKTGKIEWPVILQDVKYIENRDTIESLSKARAAAPQQVDAQSYLQFNKQCESLLQQLKANLNDYSPNDYQAARHFVENLRYTSRATAK